MRLKIQAMLIIGCWEVILLETGTYNAADENTATDPKDIWDQGKY